MENIKFKKYGIIIFILVLLIGGSISQANHPLDTIDIREIQNIRIYQEAGQYLAEINIVFYNDSGHNAGINGDLEISFSHLSDDSQRILNTQKFGDAKVNIELSAEDTRAKGKSLPVIVNIGPVGSTETVTRLLSLFNMVGNPTGKIQMHVRGKGEFAQEVIRGIAATSGRVDYTYTPKRQYEVLFE